MKCVYRFPQRLVDGTSVNRRSQSTNTEVSAEVKATARVVLLSRQVFAGLLLLLVPAISMRAQTPRVNVALSANGATATAQNYTQDSTYPGMHFQPSLAIDGVRRTSADGASYWRDEHGLSSWLEVAFSGAKTIDEIDVYTMGDHPFYTTGTDPTATQTFSQVQGATAFTVQYWDGGAWTAVSGGSITGNNLVWKRLTFTAVTTSKIRVAVNACADNVARIVELEAWSGSSNPRLDPANRTGGGGEDPLSRNFNWSLPLVSLPGRAGLDLGLSLSYNSLATWIRQGNAATFDDDRGKPSPGFRLGFPVIQPVFYNLAAGKYSYLMITPAGARVELRQVGTSSLYQAVDSSYLLLDSNAMTLKATDGTQLAYSWTGIDYACTRIMDRNGNYITVNYDSWWRIDTVVDTLSRTIKFNYSTGGDLTSITQTWGSQTHTWARFTYANKTIQTNFNGLTVSGPQNGTTIHALTEVKLADDSRYDFDYTSWGQVWKISSYAADNHLLNYRSYNLPVDNSTAQSDCPRFTIRRDWAENWNRDSNGTAQEVSTNYAVPVDAALPDNSLATVSMAKVTTADGTYQKIYFAGNISGGTGSAPAWKRGLPLLTDTFDSNNSIQRSAVTAWTQDDTSLSYQLNPRVTETNISDLAGNHARTRIEYSATTLADGTTINLPANTYEYEADATTVLRRSHVEYNLTSTYTSRRIIGLPSEQTLYGVVNGAETLMSKVSYQYDESGSIQGTDAPVQHDNTNFTLSLVAGRGNVSSVKRYDVTNTSQFTTGSMQYNTTGSVVATHDPLNHGVTISYTDQFSANGTDLDAALSFTTLAYPTMVTDAGGFSSTVRYNYSFGAATRKQTPLPNVIDNQAGPVQIIEYDSLGRVQKTRSLVNNAYTRFEYPTSQTRVDTYTTIQENAGEAHSFKITDGAGRVIATAADHPGSTGGFSGQLIIYDLMGRVIKQSNPTETSASSGSGNPYDWPAAGDDVQAGWLYTQQTYDWKGRPLVTTNTDGTTKSASYGGCGCAGGQVVTLTDEGTVAGGVSKKRQQKIYADVLGRTVKTEVLNWDGAGANGTGGTVYSATVNTFNARDQVTLVRQYQGADTSNTYQDTSMSYDGYGRLKTKHVPQQQVDANNSSSTNHTTWGYNDDDTIQQITDARGAVTTFAYNARQLLTSITYPSAPNLPAGVAATANVSFTYDAAGNRTSMTDGAGSMGYQYNNLARLTSETRTFSGSGAPSSSYTLSYQYNLAGELKKITDPTNATINYNYDSSGRIVGVTGENTLVNSVSTYASNLKQRAWGALRDVDYGNGAHLHADYNQRLLPTSLALTNLSANGAMTWNYDYYSDGRVNHTYDLSDHRFDRAQDYDNLGRLKEAYSGREAQGLSPTTPYADNPYRQSIQYDAWGNVTAKSGRFWRANQVDNANYTNSRRQDWGYDAEGNATITIGNNRSIYDAAGKLTNFINWRWSVGGSPNHPTPQPIIEIAQTYDGEGKPARRSETRRTEELISGGPQTNITETVSTVYYLYSSVLGGAKLVELDGAGQKTTGYVYANGQRLAKQQISPWSSAVTWHHPNAGGNSWVETRSDGVAERQEMDPVGAEVGTSDPFQSDPDPTYLDLKGAEPLYIDGGDPFDYSGGYEIDGLPVSSSEYRRRKDDGTVTLQKTDRLGNVLQGNNPLFLGNSVWVDSWTATYSIANTEFPIDEKTMTVPTESAPVVNIYGGNTGQFVSVGDSEPTTPLTPVQKKLAQEGVNNASKLLNRKNCAAFISNLIQRAASQVGWSDFNFVSTDGYFGGISGADALQLYRGRLDSGSIVAGGSGSSKLGITYAQTFPNSSVTLKKEFFDLTPSQRGLHTLHEALHQMKGFTDEVLANAAVWVDSNRRNLGRSYDRGNPGVAEASNDFNEILKQHCPE